MSLTIRHIAEALEAWAPPKTAQSYDNVGLQVGDAGRTVQRTLVALDLTPGVIREAVDWQADLIITHHPLIFHPLKRITTDGFVEGMAFHLAALGIALYSIHTNLDAAHGGVSFALAERLGLTDLHLLDPVKEPLFREDAGSGVDPVERPDPRTGFGVIGRLERAEPLSEFLARVAAKLEAGSLRYVGDPAQPIRCAAVCGGSGSDLTHVARSAGADAFVTADITYHKFFDVLDGDGQPTMALIDPGHYETEAMTEQLLRDWLAERFPGQEWLRTTQRTSPIRTFIPPG